jgi:hypothetical protein
VNRIYERVRMTMSEGSKSVNGHRRTSPSGDVCYLIRGVGAVTKVHWHSSTATTSYSDQKLLQGRVWPSALPPIIALLTDVGICFNDLRRRR